ncbi:MAG: translocase [Pseudomonadota bacterium]
MSDLGLDFGRRSRNRLPRVVDYAEAAEREENDLERWWAWAQGAFVSQGARLRALRLRPILRQAERHSERFTAMDDEALQTATRDLRIRLRVGTKGNLMPVELAGEAFALIREAAGRVLGMRPYDVQLLGAWAMMNGQVAEMRTGEGKTLCATLAVAATALSGKRVHVMTVNDYLAERDARETGPLYDFLGLTRAVVLEGQDAAARQSAYLQDIVYGTNKEFAFDYLRDRSILRKSPGNLRRKMERITKRRSADALRMQGLTVAFVDEADSVLIDEARTPLIISGAGELEGGIAPEVYEAGMAAAKQMVQDKHFRLPKGLNRAEITDEGFDWLDELTEDRYDTFGIYVIRDHTVMQALNALHVFKKGDAYIVKDDKVQIVDENTGRVMPDRNWSDGLHQMVELKEGLEMTEARETLSRMTYQRFFRRYQLLGGMTGTAQDAAWELWSVYRLAVAKIPTNKPDIRKRGPDRVFRTDDRKWDAIAKRVAQLHEQGQPVLIGTRTILASDIASDRLTAAGLEHQVLSADQDANEAAVVARAGQKGAIMVATNMAGRGTDIKLGQGVKDLGGLAVLISERHDSRRVDRQLEGRCGRQGEPGFMEAWLGLEDDLMTGPDARKWRIVASVISRLFGARAAGFCIRARQRQTERAHALARKDLMRQDRQLGDVMAFSGELE